MPHLVRQGRIAAIHVHVAAKDLPAVGGKPGIHGGTQAADRGNHSHTQSEAEQDSDQTSDAAAQFTPGEPERAGRWWWETQEKRECGLHLSSRGARTGELRALAKG